MKLAATETAPLVPHPSRSSPAARALGAACLGGALLAVLAARRRAPVPPPRRPAIRPDAARSLHGAAALLAFSVLADSAIEHYRGGFENPGMLAPLVTSLATAVTSLHAARSAPASPAPSELAPLRNQNNVVPAQGSAPPRGTHFPPHTDNSPAQRPHTTRTVYTTAIAIGLAGTAFHLYNIARRPGGFNWQNLFYAAPPGAPAALALSGLFGLAARRLEADRHARLLGHPAGRALAALTAGGIAGTTMEAALLHFRGAFNRAPMWLPVTVPPVAAALLLRAAGGARDRLARAGLGITALLGIAGVLFHASGVKRQMGGWHNWRQNVLAGPPLPAPPSFLALALAGRAALSLADSDRASRRPA